MTASCISNVLKNSSDYEYELLPIYHKNLNYSTAVNLGLRRTTGDYIVILSNDVEVHDPKWLEKYSQNDGITSFNHYPFYLTGEIVPDASCFGMDRVTFNKLGYLDEIFKDGYGYEDTDYWFRCKELGIPFSTVRMDIVHKENQTFKTYFSSEKEAMTEKNKQLFVKKWNL